MFDDVLRNYKVIFTKQSLVFSGENSFQYLIKYIDIYTKKSKKNHNFCFPEILKMLKCKNDYLLNNSSKKAK